MPQGSVLGPVLFLLYINDVVGVIDFSIHIRLLADDSVLFREINCPQDQADLGNILANIYKWCM